MRKVLIIGAIIVVGAAGAAAFHFSDRLPTMARAAEPEPRAPAPPPPGVPVTAGIVKAVDIPVFLTGIGTVQAMNTVAIKSRVDGQIVSVLFKEGENVKAGDPLVQIDPRPFQATLEQAEALKAKDEATLTSAQADLARSAQLVGPGYRAVQTYDQQKATVAQIQAAIKGDQAQIDMAKLNLGYTDIRAPIAGRLGVRLVDAGNMVRATDNTVLVTITQTKPIYISFTLPQEFLHKIHEKQALGDLVVQAFGGDNVTLLSEGKLTVIDNTIDQTTGTIRLKATFANDDERLWPGEFVNVRLILRTRKNAPTVPAQTVQQGSDGAYVYVIKPDDTVERRVVEISSVQDGVAVIAKGLQAGEKVVVDGQFRLTNGARVRALPAKATS